MEYFDTHMHLDDEKFDEDRNQVIQKIWNAGVTKCIDIGCDIKSSKKAIELANKNDFIYASCGIHPENLPNQNPQKMDELWKELEIIKELAIKNTKVVAIGEIGLDYHWVQTNKETQKIIFKKKFYKKNPIQSIRLIPT